MYKFTFRRLPDLEAIRVCGHPLSRILRAMRRSSESLRLLQGKNVSHGEMHGLAKKDEGLIT